MAGPRVPVPAVADTDDGRPDVYAIYSAYIGPGRSILSNLTRPSVELDPVTKEVVRLRNAALQGCNY